MAIFSFPIREKGLFRFGWKLKEEPWISSPCVSGGQFRPRTANPVSTGGTPVLGAAFAKMMSTLYYQGGNEDIFFALDKGGNLWLERSIVPETPGAPTARVYCYDTKQLTLSASDFGQSGFSESSATCYRDNGSVKRELIIHYEVLLVMVLGFLAANRQGTFDANHSANRKNVAESISAMMERFAECANAGKNFLDEDETNSLVIPLREALYNAASKNGDFLSESPFQSSLSMRMNALKILGKVEFEKWPYEDIVPAPTTSSKFITISEEKEDDEDDGKTTKRTRKRDGNKALDKLRNELCIPLIPGRVLSAEEEAMIPRLNGDTYVVDKDVARVVRSLHDYWDDLPELGLAANIILSGDSGSGKTQAAVFAADVLGRPYTKETMSPMMEDLIGAFYPLYEDVDTWGDLSDTDKSAIHMLEKRIKVGTGTIPKTDEALLRAVRGTLSDEDVRNEIRMIYGIPSADEILFDPDDAWDRMGEKGVNTPETTVMLALANEKAENAIYRLLNILLDKSSGDKVSYRFIESELVKAFRNGWLVEIQEAASILRPGVLTQLNSLLEPNGSFELPNGTKVRRHPDTIVVITTNIEYEGNVRLNESLKDRMVAGRIMNNPAPKVMADRLLARVNRPGKDVLSDEDALAAATVMREIADKAKEMQISGEFGMRSLLFWGAQIRDGKRDKETFLESVLYKMALSDEDIAILEVPYENSTFARRIKRTI